MVDVLAQVIPFLAIGFIIYLANQKAAGREVPLLGFLLYSMAILPFVYVLLGWLGGTSDSNDAAYVSPQMGAAALLITVLLSAFSLTVIRSPQLRINLRRFFGTAYNPESAVHLTAIVLIFALVSFTISNFVLSGGISGLAESLEVDESAIPNLILTQVIWILAALLGVGLMIRRGAVAAAARLGLRIPKPEDFNWGLGYGLLSYLGVIGFVVVWALLTSPEQLAEQTAASQQLAGIFSSIPQVFILSVLIAIGEEMFFRGAIQPVFGIGFTSVFFAVLHTQYTLTPATFALFGVSLVFGWLRQRHSTSAAIIAHFIYNFIQLALGILVSTS